jgi:hypothetical protein
LLVGISGIQRKQESDCLTGASKILCARSVSVMDVVWRIRMLLELIVVGVLSNSKTEESRKRCRNVVRHE